MKRTALVSILVLSVAAQGFVPNPAWRNASITTSPEERIAVAKDALDVTLSMMVDEKGQLKFEDTNYGAAANLFAQMAQFDGFTNQSIYRNQLLNLFPQAEIFRPNFTHSSINWRLGYSIAAVHAYATYSDSRFLGWAMTAWSSGNSYTLSEEELRTGKVFGKNVTIKSTCANLTMAGGTFWRNVTDDGYLNALSTGTYLIATSMLAEITKEETYLTSGIETEAFYFNHLRNAQGDMLDGIAGDSCAQRDGTYPANPGLTIEGLAVLASVAKAKATDLYDHLLEVVNKTVSNTGWHNEEGIVAADNKNQPSAEHVGQYIVRGLSAIYQRNETHSSLRDYIRQYLGVQYNAVLSNARSMGSNRNIYSASWTGPPSVSNFDFNSQTNAMSILVAAIPVRDSDSDTPGVTSAGPPTPTGSNNPVPGPRPLNIGAIAGGVIGGLALVSLILVAALYLIRRHLRSVSSRKGIEVEPESGQLQPFTLISEKNPLRPKFHLSLPATTASGFSGSSLLTSSSSTEPFRLGSMVPTEELFRMLNERLQSGREWRGEEAPPEYASHRT